MKGEPALSHSQVLRNTKEKEKRTEDEEEQTTKWKKVSKGTQRRELRRQSNVLDNIGNQILPCDLDDPGSPSAVDASRLQVPPKPSTDNRFLLEISGQGNSRSRYTDVFNMIITSTSNCAMSPVMVTVSSTMTIECLLIFLGCVWNFWNFVWILFCHRVHIFERRKRCLWSTAHSKGVMA